MISDFPDFGEVGAPAMMERPIQDEARARVELAKDILIQQAMLAVVDANGKRLTERKWREHMNFIGSL
jgi:hypothetical protein